MNQSPGLSGTGPRPARLALGIVSFIAVAYFVRPVMIGITSALAGVLLALVLDPPISQLSRRLRIRRWISFTVVLFVLAVLFGGGLWGVGSPVVSQLARLMESLPATLETVRSVLEASGWGERLLSYVPGPQEISRYSPQIVGGLSMAFSSALEVLVGSLVALFIGVYLALEPRTYVEGCLRLLRPDHRSRWREILSILGHALRWWLVGRLVSMAVVGVLTVGALTLIGISFPFGLGLLAGLLSFIPYLGPVLAAVPALLVALSQAPTLALLVAVTYVGIQGVENYLITPLVQRRLVRLPPVLVILAQVVLGLTFGLVGALLATPALIIVSLLVQTRYIEDSLGERVQLLGERS